MRGRFSEAQILSFLREAAAGTSVMELCWNHCFSRSTFRAWKAKYGEAIDAEIGRLKQLELDNARLRQSLARVSGPDLRVVVRRQLALCVGVSPPQKATKRCVEENRSAAELYVLERRQRSEKRRGGQIAGKEPPSPSAVIPKRQQHVDDAQPRQR